MDLFETPWTQEKVLRLLNDIPCEELFSKALEAKLKYRGSKIYLRGLINIKNTNAKNCYYCGAHMEHHKSECLYIKFDEITDAALWSLEAKYGSIIIQGECFEEAVEEVASLLKNIKEKTQGKLGIVLSLGKQTKEIYQKWFEAGAHRYVWRAEIPLKEEYGFKERVKDLNMLRGIGYQVSAGIIIGYTGRSQVQLAEDLLFLYEEDMDMVGMEFHRDQETFLKKDPHPKSDEKYDFALKIIAIARLMRPKANIASTIALQDLHSEFREKCLMAGANMLIPNITDMKYLGDYSLYEGKHCAGCLKRKVEAIGHEIAFEEWAYSPRFLEKNK